MEQGKLELRFLYDCEKMQNVLQFRYAYDANTATAWANVPIVYNNLTG